MNSLIHSYSVPPDLHIRYRAMESWRYFLLSIIRDLPYNTLKTAAEIKCHVLVRVNIRLRFISVLSNIQSHLPRSELQLRERGRIEKSAYERSSTVLVLVRSTPPSLLKDKVERRVACYSRIYYSRKVSPLIFCFCWPQKSINWPFSGWLHDKHLKLVELESLCRLHLMSRTPYEHLGMWRNPSWPFSQVNRGKLPMHNPNRV